MSKNSQMNTRTMTARRANAAEDFTIAEAMDEVQADAAIPQRGFIQGGKFVSAAGVESLVDSAKAEFVAKTGAILPWNLNLRSGGDFGGTGINYGPGNLGRDGRRMPTDEANKVIDEWARFAGWLRAARDCDALSRMIKKTQGGGQGAKATKFDLWEMQRRWPSPGRLERMVRAVRDRANAILKAYAGHPHVSNKGIALGLMAERSVGKAAVVAVAVTFGVGEIDYFDKIDYRAARTSLIDLHTCYPIVREDDGVHTRVDSIAAHTAGDVAVYAAKFSGEGRVTLDRKGWLVVRGERTYHVEYGKYEEMTPETALSQALDAWRLQDYHCREEQNQFNAQAELRAELVAFLKGEETGICPLITYEDSYKAGNCRPGTEAWVREMGFAGREFLPGTALIPFLSDGRVLRVAQAAREARAA